MPEGGEELEISEPEVGMDILEIPFSFEQDKIMRATLRACQSGSVTPLIKEELRCTIQSRRLAAGKGELKLEEFKRPAKKKTMTDEERKKALIRRTQNREAAQRFRQRQKDQASYLTDKIKRLEKSSANLQNNMLRLRHERDELKSMLEAHMAICSMQVPTPDINYLNDQFPRPCSTLSTTDTFTTITSYCSDTTECSSSVFLPDDMCCGLDKNHPLASFFQFEGIGDNNTDNKDLCWISAETPEVVQELTVEEADLVDSLSEYSDDQRHVSCSSTETMSNYDSVSSDNTSPNDLTSETGEHLIDPKVLMIPFYSGPFEYDEALQLDPF